MFHTDFNLTVCGTNAIYFKRTLWKYLMAIHQTKFASICDCYQIAKLNVCQMYHVLLWYVNYVCTIYVAYRVTSINMIMCITMVINVCSHSNMY